MVAVQNHLRELADLDESFRETLDRDRQEREVQVKVQRENDAVVVDSLKRRCGVNGVCQCRVEVFPRLRSCPQVARFFSGRFLRSIL